MGSLRTSQGGGSSSSSSSSTGMVNTSAAIWVPHDQYDFKLNFPTGLEIEWGIAAGLIATGAMLLLFGIDHSTKTMLLYTAVSTGSLTYMICALIYRDTWFALLVGGSVASYLTYRAFFAWGRTVVWMAVGMATMCWLSFRALLPGWVLHPTLQYGSLVALILTFVPVSVCLNEWWVFGSTPIIGAFFLVQGIEYFIPEDPNLFRIAVAHVGCTTLTCKWLYASTFVVPLFGGILQWQLTSRRAQRKRDGYAAVTADDGTNSTADNDEDGTNENVIHVRRSGGSGGGRASSFITRTIMNRAASDATVEQSTPEMYRPYEDDDEENTRTSLTASASSQIVSRAMVTAPRDGSSSMVSLSAAAAAAAGGAVDEGQEMTTISITSQPSSSSSPSANNNNGHNNGSVMIGVGARRTASQWEELKVK